MFYNSLTSRDRLKLKDAVLPIPNGSQETLSKRRFDPIQQLFVDKLREYKQKSSGGTKLVEASPVIEKELKSELEKAAKQYGSGPGVDMTKFPTFKFSEPTIDPINLEKS
ncbi:hypothetical protein Trydic_g18269 [Trypoxylus dichotomus]